MNAEEIVFRIRSNLRQKIMLSAVLSATVWGIYLLLQRRPLFPVTTMRVARIDQLIPFVPSAVYLYESLLLLMPIAPWLMHSREELSSYARGLIVISLAGFLIFFFCPTSSPRPKDLTDINLLYGTLVRIDNELNAFPSLHAAFAVFHGACCYSVFSAGRWHRVTRCVIWVWVSAIIVSTLLTKQHVCLDAMAGAVLGFAGYALCCRSTMSRSKDTKGL